ncbi:MAG: SDR family oxidoreductase [Flavobacteriales bacterium]|nr:SDR family oxidoreductase [Flavobacteriales bacterium]
MNLNDKKILVTGGSSGLGKATAKLLIEAGAIVLITGRDGEKLKNVAEEIGAKYLQFDISEYDTINQKGTECIELLGGIDVLINNAGVGERAMLGEITIELLERTFATNVFGLTMLTQLVVDQFKSQEKGNIINIASTAALNGYPNGSVYCASKFALRGITECWRAELRKHNVRVTLVNPSEVPTAFANKERIEREEVHNKLTSVEIATAIKGVLEMDDRGFIPELSVWASNPFD